MGKWNKRKKQYTWKTIVAALTCVVVFSTVFALTLPAIAMDEQCGLEEHQHTEACYTYIYQEHEQDNVGNADVTESTIESQTIGEKLPAVGEKVLTCTIPEHTHTEACSKKQETVPTEAAEHEQPQETMPTLETENQADVDTAVEETVTPTEATVPNEFAAMQLKAPLDVSKYVVKADLRYRDKSQTGAGGWQEMQPGVPIPGNSKLRLDIKYERVRVPDLIASGCQLRFDVPKIMRNPTTQGDIINEGKIIGSITTSENVLLLTFHQDWLEQLRGSGNGLVNGSFYVESDINLSEIPADGTGLNLVFGNVQINPTFEPDIVAQHGKIDIEKTVCKQVVQAENGHFLEYTLKVKAGIDGMPDVKIVDYFETNRQYIEYVNLSTTPVRLTKEGIPREVILDGKQHGEIYRGTLPTDNAPIPAENGTEIVEPGSLIWKIGDMAPNEERTLVYRVKVANESGENNEQAIRNRARVFSKSYKRNDAVADFTPKADLDMNKSHIAPERNNVDGSYKIKYTVWFEAPKSNNHTLDNVQIKDSLTRTQTELLPYIRYDENSFKLYRSKRPEGALVEINKQDGTLPTLSFLEGKKEFVLSVGDMEAGASYCLQYDVIVDAKAFGAASVDGLTVQNRVIATAKNAHAPSKDFIQAFSDNCFISYKNWIHKTVSQSLEEALTITLPRDHVYDATSGSIVPDSGTPVNFTVPAGSYRYTIVMNNLGDWDVTKATIRDALSKNQLQYTGYMQVDAYDPRVQGSDALGTLVETHWLKINELQSFRLSLSEIGFAEKNYAFRITYYAVPVDLGSISTVVVSNTVSIGGTIGKDGQQFEIGDFSSKAEITIHGGRSFEARKYPWYYENSQVSQGTWSKGAIYWGIKIDGTGLHKGSIIRDFVKQEHEHHERGKIFFHGDSFVGIYKGKFPDGVRFDSYNDLQSMVNSGYVKELPADVYCNVSYEDRLNINRENTFSDVYVEIKESIALEAGDSVYLIIKSEPDSLPTGYRTKKQYTNYLDIGDSKNNMISSGLATKELYGGQNILKEVAQTFKFDGTNITNIHTYRRTSIPKELLKSPGHYITWGSKINYGGDLSGRYRVVDELPEGVELAYVRLQWLGSAVRNKNIRMVQIENYKQTLGEEWQEHAVTAPMDQASGQYVSYYYTKGNKILWEVDNVEAGHRKDDFAADFQITCRITDPDVLQGGVNKEFLNRIYLQQPDGTQLDSASSGTELSVKTIDKTGKIVGNTAQFTIALNPTGEDLLKDAETVTLVDEMSPTLSLNIDSLRVVNTRTNEPVTVKALLDEQTLMIVLPDDQPLTVTYTAHIHAVPDTHVTLSNNAYWLGYSTGGGDSVQIENFYYTVGGTAGSTKSPVVKILKYDANDILHHLEGAQFRMEEGTMEHGVFTGNGNVWTGTTGADGILTFGTGTQGGHQMRYNTVYCVRETKAPAGYVLDDTPHYFIIATKVGDTYPQFPEGIHVHYADGTHTYRAPNRKGEAYVVKQFQKLDGTTVNAIPGQYRFGLFDNAEGAGKPIQVVTLNYTETTADQKGTFVDLELDKTYYVFELDDTLNPILPGNVGYVNSTPFQVEYQSDGNGGIHAVNSGNTVTVTNRMCMESMPETGGIGTEPFTIAGLLLVLSGTCLAYYQFKRRKYSK